MKAKDVLKIMGITRYHMCRLVKQGKIGVTKQPNGYYIYNAEDVYKVYSVGKNRLNLHTLFMRGYLPANKKQT
jgi:predicted site-specific integrase-resolvase